MYKLCSLQVYFDVVEEIDCIIDKHVSSHVNIHSFIGLSNRFIVETGVKDPCDTCIIYCY